MRRPPILGLLLAAAAGALPAQTDDLHTVERFRGLAFRGIGPNITTGRIADLEVDPGDPSTWYLAVGSGGLFKTDNRGNTWTPIFDEYPAYSFGCVVVDPADSDVVWVGTGENTHNRSASWGTGVYKSTDGGATWKLAGLGDSQKIQRILIDPRDSNVVYVAAAGPLWNAGGDRGLYKTTDGGATWRRVLHVSDDTGITEACFRPGDPDVIYAAAYQRRRRNAMTLGGGPEGGILRSTDAGATWERIENGLPEVDMGRIALGVDPRVPERVYALVVARGDAGGFFVSEDGGDSWTRQSDYSGGDPQYYGEIFVDPHRPDTIWDVSVRVMRSTDKGVSWEPMRFDMHVDNHEIVFDDDDPEHMWVGNDGGLYETFDAGATWRHFTSLPVSQFYRVSADDSRPFYRVTGGAQDNGTVAGPSRTRHRVGIRTSDWYRVGGGDGFQAVFDPNEPHLVYGMSQNGALYRLDLETGDRTGIRPTTGGDDEGRWHWDSPLVVSEHAAGRIYYAGNRLYRSDDRGDHWQAVSGDLTRDLDRMTMPIMGKVQDEDAVGLHLYTTTMSVITALAESPIDPELLYTGSDDGLIHVTEDGGASWTSVAAIEGLPPHSYVTDLFASRLDPDVVFATFNNWQNGDFRPWVWRSDDRGRSWVNVTGDLPERSGTWSIVQDHVDPELLFVGCEFGVFFSVDRGERWVELRGGIPRIQARDLHVQRHWDDLVVGTFGRGIFILDDYSALRDVDAESLAAEAALFRARPARVYPELGQVQRVWGDVAEPNPPFGATLTYHLRDAVPDGAELVLTITDEAGEVVRRLELDGAPGVHRVTWDLRRGGRRRGGELVPPGRYEAALAIRKGDGATPVAAPRTVLVVPLSR